MGTLNTALIILTVNFQRTLLMSTRLTRTHLKVPVFQNSDESPYRNLVAHGLVKIVGDDTCSIEYDKGHEVPKAATHQALPSLAAFEQRVAAVDCL